MKVSKFYVAVIVFTVMAAFSACKKDGVTPVKTLTVHQNANLATSSDSTGYSGGQEPVKPPKP